MNNTNEFQNNNDSNNIGSNSGEINQTNNINPSVQNTSVMDNSNSINNSFNQQDNTIQTPISNIQNDSKKKKNNIVVLIFILVAIVFVIMLLFVGIKKYNSSSSNSSVKTGKKVNNKLTFSDDVVLGRFTIYGVKLSELCSLDDFINKTDLKINSVYIQDASDETYAYSSKDYDKFLKGEYSDIEISDMYFSLYDEKNKNSVNFYVSYDNYLKYKNKVIYRHLDFYLSDGELKLDGKSLRDYSPRNLREMLNTYRGYGLYLEYSSKEGNLYYFKSDKIAKNISIKSIKKKKENVEKVNNKKLISLEEIKNIEAKYDNSEVLFNIKDISETYRNDFLIDLELVKGTANDGDIVEYVDWYGNIKKGIVTKSSFAGKDTYSITNQNNDIEDSNIVFKNNNYIGVGISIRADFSMDKEKIDKLLKYIDGKKNINIQIDGKKYKSEIVFYDKSMLYLILDNDFDINKSNEVTFPDADIEDTFYIMKKLG